MTPYERYNLSRGKKIDNRYKIASADKTAEERNQDIFDAWVLYKLEQRKMYEEYRQQEIEKQEAEQLKNKIVAEVIEKIQKEAPKEIIKAIKKELK